MNITAAEIKNIAERHSAQWIAARGNSELPDQITAAISEALSRARSEGAHLVSCWACNNQNLRRTENGAFKCITCGELTVLDNAETSARSVTEGEPGLDFKDIVEQFLAKATDEELLALLDTPEIKALSKCENFLPRVPSGELGELLKPSSFADKWNAMVGALVLVSTKISADVNSDGFNRTEWIAIKNIVERSLEGQQRELAEALARLGEKKD